MFGAIRRIKGDKVIWAVVIILSVFSLLAVYSSTGTLAYKKQGGNTEYYMLKHLTILVFGFGLMYVTHLFKYNYYSRISQVAIVVAAILLMGTLAMGTNYNEASRWLTLPVINLTFQSSDFAKLALIMYVARLISKKQEQIKDFKSAFIPVLAPIIIICGLIFPANLSTAGMLFITCLVLMFIGRINLRYILSMVGIFIAAMGILIIIIYNSPAHGRLGTWHNRITNYVNGDGGEEDYQVEQGKIAIATGGFFGKMPGRSTQRNFLPHPYSDFIFAIIIEEYGLLGGAFLVMLYLILLFRGTRIVVKSPGNFGAFLAIGISFSLVFQAMVNMAVAVHIFPVTGQPLPFVSMGGTSIWFTSISIGILLSISKEIDNPTPKTVEADAA
jgi:cell division protein FtsW